MGHNSSKLKKQSLTLDQFPPDLLIQIFVNLDFSVKTKDIVNVSRTCKRFNQALCTEYLWKCVYTRFGLTLGLKPYHSRLVKTLCHTWDNNYSSEFICISENGARASRHLQDGSNPAVLGKFPLEPNTSIQIRVLSIGKWLSIGLATRDFELNDDCVVGTQHGSGPNIGLYSIDTRQIKLSTTAVEYKWYANDYKTLSYCEGGVLKMSRIGNNLYIYWNNLKLNQYVKDFPTQYTFYPCVSLSEGSSVEFVV